VYHILPTLCVYFEIRMTFSVRVIDILFFRRISKIAKSDC